MSSEKNIDTALLEKMKQSYLDNPHSVDPSWREFFAPSGIHAQGLKRLYVEDSLSNQGDYVSCLDAYRSFGYLMADLDPLGLRVPDKLPQLLRAEQTLETKEPVLLEMMRDVYCGHISAQYMFLSSEEQIEWIRNKLEVNPFNRRNLSDDSRNAILDALIMCNGFEEFVHVKFQGVKRFSIEGGDSVMIAVEALLDFAATNGYGEFIMGMSHRGRLNLTVNLFGKPYRALFSELAGQGPFPSDCKISGDVKYHFGYGINRKSLFSDAEIHASLLHNPSHLEAVDAPLLGKARAMQDSGIEVFPVLHHGDAAFAGQGIVYESMTLDSVSDYKTGGTIHIIANNQIGFTTPPENSRKQVFPSFIGESFDIPIFHVNADNPDAVFHVARLAAEFRDRFKKSVIIDIVAYRRYGHNEVDEPRFTQPRMYDRIESHPRVVNAYASTLIGDGLLTQEKFALKKDEFKKLLDSELSQSNDYQASYFPYVEEEWKQCIGQELKPEYSVDSGLEKDILLSLSERANTLPEGFEPNPKVVRLLKQRYSAVTEGVGIDWGNGENLAFASILRDGFDIRLSGQDCKRGTFSHRHAVLFSSSSGAEFCPLNEVSEAKIDVVLTPLSEYAALGFEYGYSSLNPRKLVIWEAQFGDFANGGQIVIDQYIASAEIKWLMRSGLVMLLPHAYEGQGPEHSSARVERFLQLSAQNNMRVVNCTTPANFFHVLRRQVLSEIVRPLIVFTPKSLLRHKMAVSKLEDFSSNTTFKAVISNEKLKEGVKRIVFCSGKVYYDLAAECKSDFIALVRIEQLYPFPLEEISKILSSFGSAEIVWCQEEPKNMGAWFFIREMLQGLAVEIKYVGRAAAASPSEGLMKDHAIEQARLVNEALTM